jgi:hypothetical protein
MSEVAISIDWASGKAEILEGVTGRQYPKKDGWQFGTADLVCVLKTGELLIADWKTGGTDGATEQLLSLACGFQKALTVTEVIVTNAQDFTYEAGRPVRVACLKVTDYGVEADERAVSDEQLANHWLAMEMAWEGKDKKNAPVPGTHCTQLYCPHLAYCPAITGLVTDSAQEEQSREQRFIPVDNLVRKPRLTAAPKDDYEAGFTMALVYAARRQLKYYESSVREYLSKGNRAVSGQYEWGETNSGFRWRKHG